MKTLKQWFDGLSAATQAHVEKNAEFWFDKSRPDYRRITEPDIPQLKAQIKEDGGIRYDQSKTIAHLISMVHKLIPADLTKAQHDLWIQELIRQDKTTLKYLSLDQQREYIQESRVKNGQYELFDLLFLSDDFGNINWKRLNPSSIELNEPTMEILGFEQSCEMAKLKPSLMNIKSIDINNDIFDTLFFGENGWTDRQKHDVLGEYKANTRDVADFMKRIVTVDKSYLREVYRIIERNTALAAELYKLKKDTFDLKGDENTEMLYRYPKEFRRLFQIAACCERKNVGKAMAGTIGDSAALMKLYSWDWNMVFDCLYPEYARVIAQDENEEE